MIIVFSYNIMKYISIVLGLLKLVRYRRIILKLLFSEQKGEDHIRMKYNWEQLVLDNLLNKQS